MENKKKFIGPKEKSLGKRMCRMVTGHKPREKWAQHDHYGRMLYYYQCKRCGHLFWTEEAPEATRAERSAAGNRRNGGLEESGPLLDWLTRKKERLARSFGGP